MDLNLRVIKEPRGFIRIVQFFFAIFAFSTTAGFSGSSTAKVECTQTASGTLTLNYGYPFKNFELTAKGECAESAAKSLSFAYNFSSSAEFFVTTGVLAFLYSLGISVIYILMNQLYTSNQVVPIADLGITGALTIFWLAGSSAWAQGVSDIKYYSSSGFIIKRIPNCAAKNSDDDWACNVEDGKYASLNISLILGFANCLLWGASLWFVFKETTFHQKYQAGMQPGQGIPPGMTGQQQQQPPMPPQTQPGLQSPEEYKY